MVMFSAEKGFKAVRESPILANLKYARQIDVMVRLPEDRRMYEQLMGILRVIPEAWQEHPDVRYLSGHKQARQMRVAKMDELND